MLVNRLGEPEPGLARRRELCGTERIMAPRTAHWLDRKIFGVTFVFCGTEVNCGTGHDHHHRE